MWSGFIAGVLAAIAAVVSVVLGWFFNQSSKDTAVRKALQLEIDANWQRLENFRKATWPGKSVDDLTKTIDSIGLRDALQKNRMALSGWQRSIWNNNLVQIVSSLRAQDVQRLQKFYTLLERLDYLAEHKEVEEAVKILVQLLREKKPDIRTAQWFDPVLSFIRTKW